MGEIFANHISDRELISEIYKEFLHLIAEKQSFFFFGHTLQLAGS